MTDEELLLQEYAEWLQLAASAIPDTSPAAFLLERRNEANEVKIRNALFVLDYMIGVVDRSEKFDTPELVDLQDFITELRSMLRGQEYDLITTTDGNTE
jgi:hypothetical protein